MGYYWKETIPLFYSIPGELALKLREIFQENYPVLANCGSELPLIL
jgi:hypothetical protein